MFFFQLPNKALCITADRFAAIDNFAGDVVGSKTKSMKSTLQLFVSLCGENLDGLNSRINSCVPDRNG